MKLKALAAVAVLAISGPAMATLSCTSSTTIGPMGPPDISYAQMNNSFWSAVGTFADCYAFSVDAWTDTFGGVVSWDTSRNYIDISVGSVSLYSNGTLIGSDSSPEDFTFNSLDAGSYQMVVSGSVTNTSTSGQHFPSPVGYSGGFSTIAAAVPEPESYAMMLAGFLSVGAVALRRKKA